MGAARARRIFKVALLVLMSLRSSLFSSLVVAGSLYSLQHAAISASKLAIVVVIVELALMAGGRTFDSGPITLTSKNKCYSYELVQ